MKELVLFVNGQTVGPFSAEDLAARVAAGEFPPETPCAEAGSAEWKTLADFVPAEKKPSVRVARKTRSEEEAMKEATSEKLDPDVRKKLLLYNLADAISVDKFTPVQAAAAIKIHEEALKKDKKLKIAAGVGAFAVSAVLASLLFNGLTIGTAPGGRGLKIFETIFMDPPNPEYAKHAKRVASDALQLGRLREEVAAVGFSAPRGQSSRQFFLNNVEIKNPDVSTVTGTLDTSALAGTLPAGMLETATFEILQLSRLDSTAEELIAAQDKLLADCSGPLWTDDDLRRAIAEELDKSYPREGTDASEEIEKRLKTFRVENLEAQLHWVEKRVREIAKMQAIQGRLQGRMKARYKKQENATTQDPDGVGRVADRQTESEQTQFWASRDMPKFLEKFRRFLDEKKIFYSAEARAAAWRKFTEEDLPKISETVEKHLLQRVPVGAKGEFSLPGRNVRKLIVAANFAGPGEVFYVPAEDGAEASPIAVRDLKTNRKVLTPEDVLMDERYVVSAKTKAGGVPVCASGKLLGREIFVVRTTPEWFYVTVEKVRDPESASSRRTSVLLGVPADFFAAVNVGDEVPMEKLLTFSRFSRPAESPSGGRLSPIPEDKMETVRAQQEEAGLAFPPPPEIYVPPPAPAPKTSTPPPAEEEKADAAA